MAVPQDHATKDLDREIALLRAEMANLNLLVWGKNVALDKRLRRAQKKLDAMGTFIDINQGLKEKTDDLYDAAGLIGLAYRKAARRHRQAIERMAKEEAAAQALQIQLMFLGLQMLTAGALSWATEYVKSGITKGAASRLAVISEEEAIFRSVTFPSLSRASRSVGIEQATNRMFQQAKADVSTSVSAYQLVTAVSKDVVGTGLRGVVSIAASQVPPSSQVWMRPASVDPEDFKDELELQIRGLVKESNKFMTYVARQIGRAQEAEWDNYQDLLFRGAYILWQYKASYLAGSDDLQGMDVETMADELERWMWAMWTGTLIVPYTEEISRGHGEPFPVQRTAYVHVREPVNARLRELGIERNGEDEWRRDKEDEFLVEWGANYLRSEIQPWMKGKAAARNVHW
jgi:hypothetical protein